MATNRCEVLLHVPDRVVVRLVPVANQTPSEKPFEAILADFDRLAVEIGKAWQGNACAVAAVREVRREL